MDDNEWKCEKRRKKRKRREKDEENEIDENKKLNSLPDELDTWNLDYTPREMNWLKQQKGVLLSTFWMF